MYNIRACDYVPSPHPATSDRIIAAHYYPAWKKNATGVHRGFDDLHDYPERTPLVGYYDGDSPEVADWEIKWALEHGINCFIYCWYRKKENMGKPLTAEDLRLGESLHEGFLKARYASQMRFAIMFEAQNKWGGSDPEDLIQHLMPFWLENYFSRDNYLKIDNKPVVFVYDYQHQLRDGMGGADTQKKAFDRCRDLAREHGFDGLIFAVEYRKDDPSAIDDYRARGYDFSFAYCWSIKEPNPSDERVVELQLDKIRKKREEIPDFFVPTAACMWDPSPRFVSMPHIYTPQNQTSLWKLDPNHWRKLLAEIRTLTDALPEDSVGRKILMLDNWNEWDEGHYIAPSLEFGFQYLQAVREEFTERDNLPDYRLPETLGTNSLNSQWDVPDLGEKPLHCK